MRKLKYDFNQAWIDLGYKDDMASGKLMLPRRLNFGAFTISFQLITQLPPLHYGG